MSFIFFVLKYVISIIKNNNGLQWKQGKVYVNQSGCETSTFDENTNYR